MKALFILSIIIPVGLLTTFRFTGILEGPLTISETITLEALEWDFQRPNGYVVIGDVLQNQYESNGLSATFSIAFVDYWNNSQFLDDNDFLRMAIKANSTLSSTDGFLESVYVVFGKDPQPSLVEWGRLSMKFENLSVSRISDGWTRGDDYRAAFVRLNPSNHADKIYFFAVVEWGFLSPKTITNQVEVTFELTYYNGTAYNRVIQPFRLKVIGG